MIPYYMELINKISPVFTPTAMIKVRCLESMFNYEKADTMQIYNKAVTKVDIVDKMIFRRFYHDFMRILKGIDS